MARFHPRAGAGAGRVRGNAVQRVRDGAKGINGEGLTDIAQSGPGKPAARRMQLEYDINSLSLEPREAGAPNVRLDGFALSLVGDGRAQLKTDVSVRDGEEVVVGTSTVQDRGLIVVVSARVIR